MCVIEGKRKRQREKVRERMERPLCSIIYVERAKIRCLEVKGTKT